MTIDIDWRAAWIAEQEHRGRSDDATRWDERSANYAKVSGTSSYASTFLDYAGVREGETVLDMGCGSGALALPLAQDGHEVYACDFSRGMLDALMETAFRLGVNEHVHPMLLAWDDDWTTAGVPVCDVALASRSIATGDMQAALAKLDEHARRRVCITLTTGLSPRVDPVLLDAIGREQPRYPDCVFAFNILWDMGVHPELSDRVVSRASTRPSTRRAMPWAPPTRSANDSSRTRDSIFTRFTTPTVGHAGSTTTRASRPGRFSRGTSSNQTKVAGAPLSGFAGQGSGASIPLANRRFYGIMTEPFCPHRLAVRTSALQAEDRGFESRWGRH